MQAIGTPWYEKHTVRHRFAGREELELPVPLVGFPDCQAINARIVCNGPGGSSETNHILDCIIRWEDSAPFATMITRVEFLHHVGDGARLGLRGAVLFDNSDTPFVHVVNALLGYDGSGPSLSHKLMTKVLHMSAEEAKQLNESVRQYTTEKRSYVAILDLNPITYKWESDIVLE